MTNLPATHSDVDDYAKMAALTGQHVGGTTNNLPRLFVNRDFVDDKERTLPAGSFAVDIKDVGLVFGKPVVFRPMLQRFQYRRWDNDKVTASGKKGAYTATSVMNGSFQEEFLDDVGTVKCGRPPGNKKDWTEAQKLTGKDVKTFRVFFGTVTFDGKTADGAPYEVVDLPVEMRHSGGNYNALDELIKTLDKQNILLPKIKISLDTVRSKSGSTILYTVVPTFDLTTVIGISAADFEVMTQFGEHIKVLNKNVITRHNKALTGRQGDDPADEGLAGDLADVPDED